MTSKEYVVCRLIHKKANAGLLKEANWFTDAWKYIFGLSEKAAEKGYDLTSMLLPVLGIAGGYGLAKATSPRGVAENASELAINAMERASLAESLRDLETLKASNKLRKQTRKTIHDQFI